MLTKKERKARRARRKAERKANPKIKPNRLKSLNSEVEAHIDKGEKAQALAKMNDLGEYIQVDQANFGRVLDVAAEFCSNNGLEATADILEELHEAHEQARLPVDLDAVSEVNIIDNLDEMIGMFKGRSEAKDALNALRSAKNKVSKVIG